MWAYKTHCFLLKAAASRHLTLTYFHISTLCCLLVSLFNFYFKVYLFAWYLSGRHHVVHAVRSSHWKLPSLEETTLIQCSAPALSVYLGISMAETLILLQSDNFMALSRWYTHRSAVCSPFIPPDVNPTITQDRCCSLGMAALGLSPGAGRGAKMFSTAPPALAQNKVIIGWGAHGIKHVGFVGYLELWGRKRNAD